MLTKIQLVNANKKFHSQTADSFIFVVTNFMKSAKVILISIGCVALLCCSKASAQMHKLFFNETVENIPALEDSIKTVTGYDLVIKDTSRRFVTAEIFTNKKNEQLTVQIVRSTITATPFIREVIIKGEYEDILKLYITYIVPATVLDEGLIRKTHHGPVKEIEIADRKVTISFTQFANNVWELSSSSPW